MIKILQFGEGNFLRAFSNSVIERFSNPFIDHKLLDISLNSVAKFKARCLCSLLDYYSKFGKIPSVLSFSFAALINFYENFKNKDYPACANYLRKEVENKFDKFLKLDNLDEKIKLAKLKENEHIIVDTAKDLKKLIDVLKQFEQLKDIRSNIQLPIILMGYMNPILQFGIEKFCATAKAVGVDGVILPDLPMYEFETMYKPLFDKNNLKFVFLY